MQRTTEFSKILPFSASCYYYSLHHRGGSRYSFPDQPLLIMKKYIPTLIALALAVNAISFLGCGGPAEDPDALGEGEPATTAGDSEKDKADAKKMGYELPDADGPSSPKKD